MKWCYVNKNSCRDAKPFVDNMQDVPFFSYFPCKGSDKCGEHNYPCEDCGKEDCMDSDNKCKWFDKNENAIWSPQGPQGFCKPNCVCNGLWDNGGRGGNCSAGGEGMKWCYVNKNSCRDAKPFVDNMQDVPFFSYFPCKGSDKCGEHNYPCEDCGKEECMDSDKCKWIDGNGNARWSPQGPQGFCKPKDGEGGEDWIKLKFPGT